jgi:hypothetical protein
MRWLVALSLVTVVAVGASCGGASNTAPDQAVDGVDGGFKDADLSADRVVADAAIPDSAVVDSSPRDAATPPLRFQASGFHSYGGLMGVSATASEVWSAGYKTDAQGTFHPCIFSSGDGGQTWTLRFTGPANVGYFVSTWASPTGELFAGAGITNTVYHSMDGTLWSPQAIPAIGEPLVVWGFVGLSNGAIVGVGGSGMGSKGFVVRTTNHGSTWTRTYFSTDREWTAVAAVGGNVLVAAGYNGMTGTGELVRSGDGGQTWTSVHRNSTGYQAVYAAPGANAIFAAGGDISRSTDLGQTWSTVTADSGDVYWMGLAEQRGALYAAGIQGTGPNAHIQVRRSADQGGSWDTALPPSLDGTSGVLYRISDNGRGGLVAVGDNRATTPGSIRVLVGL